MLFMIVNRTRTDLNGEQMQRLGRLAQAFYDGIPEGIHMQGDWAATDRSRTFALIDAPDLQSVEDLQAPFREFVDMEVVPVVPVTGWGKQ